MKNYNFDSLRNYALWYFYKYYISPNKLKNKLLEKSLDKELSQKVFDSISYLIDEKTLIIDKINIYKLRNKNLNYIKTSLLKSLFDKNLIEELIIQEIWEETILNKRSLLIKIQNYKLKNKSINYIKHKLIQRSCDEEIVKECIYEVFWEGEDYENLKNEYEKLINKNIPKEKITQKLLMKWFKYDNIKNWLIFK